MTNLLNTKVLLSGAMIAAAAAVVIGATFAFFSDTEESTGNVLAAGALDLKIDSEAHFNGLVCTEVNEALVWQADGITFVDNEAVPSDHYPQPGDACVGTFDETDLDPENPLHRFFDLTDIKPGDIGENTISVHVDNNDAWLRVAISSVTDTDATCTEPENEAEGDGVCVVDGVNNGELDDAVDFAVWLDQGSIPGFQNNDPETSDTDATEGDNIWQEADEPVVNIPGVLGDGEITFDFDDYLASVYTSEGCTVTDGHTDYGSCHGLAQDGRVVGSAVYYFGVGWTVDSGAGNEIQTDELSADISFLVEQHRNNPTPFLP